MVGDKYDICCEECGRYLFTVEEIPYESDNGSSLGREIRVNDYMDYTYTNDEKFVCNKCAEGNTCTDM